MRRWDDLAQIDWGVDELNHWLWRCWDSLSLIPCEPNPALVEAGQAAVYPRYCDDSRYVEAQKRAQAARRGIWAKRGEHQTPWTWRRGQR